MAKFELSAKARRSILSRTVPIVVYHWGKLDRGSMVVAETAIDTVPYGYGDKEKLRRASALSAILIGEEEGELTLRMPLKDFLEHASVDGGDVT